MISGNDVYFHNPPDNNPVWGETNFFAFYIPERNICGSVYIVMRKPLGVCMADITIFDRVSLDRRDCLYIHANQHLPAPDDLSDYTLPNGLHVKAVRPPLDYEVRYRGRDGVELDLDFRALMNPYDIHDESVDPNAREDTRQEGENFDIVAYNGHFDLTGRVTGRLKIKGEEMAIDCIDTMDHSWGPRPENGLPMVCWMHAHFGEELAMHLILTFDPDKPVNEQFHFLRGYVLEKGKLMGGVSAEVQANRVGRLGVGMDVAITDDSGRTHRFYGTAVSATNVTWYSSMDIAYALHRWVNEDGRIGYGCVQEGWMMDELTARTPLMS